MKMKKCITVRGIRIPYDAEAIYFPGERLLKHSNTLPAKDRKLFWEEVVDAMMSLAERL